MISIESLRLEPIRNADFTRIAIALYHRDVYCPMMTAAIRNIMPMVLHLARNATNMASAGISIITFTAHVRRAGKA